MPFGKLAIIFVPNNGPIQWMRVERKIILPTQIKPSHGPLTWGTKSMSQVRMEEMLKRNTLSLYLADKALDFLCKDTHSFIFVATTGRSGSSTLAKIFSLIEGVASFHEPYPIMNNTFMPGEDKIKYFERMFRIKKIRIKKSACGHNHYIETNHEFIKTFNNHAAQCFGKKLKIIHLERDPHLVARSFYQIGSIPGKTEKGKRWLLDPADNDNVIQISDLLLHSDKFKHDLYKCLWYWHEIKARIKKMKEENPDIFFYKIKTEEMNDSDKIKDMLEKLEIKTDVNDLVKYTKLKDNLKLSKKTNNIEAQECKEMNYKLLEEINSRYGGGGS